MGKKEDFAREHAGTEIPSRAVVVSNTLGAVAVCSYLHCSHLCCRLLALRIPKESQAQADVPTRMAQLKEEFQWISRSPGTALTGFMEKKNIQG